MINGWTRNTPTPTPVTRPASAAMSSATSSATSRPCGPTMVATTNPDIEATAPTERSMPPVRNVSVWQHARTANGIAARSVTPTQPGLMTSGLSVKKSPTSRPSRPRSGISG